MLACLLIACSGGGDDAEQHGAGAASGASEDGGVSSGPANAGAGGRGGNAGSSGRAGSAGSEPPGQSGQASGCVPDSVPVLPMLAATPTGAVDRTIDIAEARAQYGSLVADGSGGVWLIANEPLALTSTTATGIAQLLHYGADGGVISQQALTGDPRWDPNLLLIGGSQPRLVGTYGKHLDLGSVQLGDGSTPGLFVATLADAGLAVESELQFSAGSDPLAYRVVAGARDDVGRVLLALDFGVAIPGFACVPGQLAVVGVDGADVGMRGCVDHSDPGQGALAPDGEGGAYVTVQGAVVRVASDGSEQWRHPLAQAASNMTLDALARGEDGVVVAGSFAGNLQLGSASFAGSSNGRDLLLFALHADGSDDWARAFATRGNARPRSLERLADGSLLLAGTFEDALALGDGVLLSQAPAQPSTASDAYADALVLKLDATGTPLAAQRVGGDANDGTAGAVADGLDGAWLYAMQDYTGSAPQLVHVALGSAQLPPPLDRSTDPLVHIAAPTGFEEQDFGQSIVADGDLAVVGRTLHLLRRDAAGAFRVGEQLERPGDATDSFAQTMALSSKVLAVADAAPAWDDQLGRVYVYARDGEHFTLEDRLQPSQALADNDSFGRSLALIGETLFVASEKGVFVFERDAAGWHERDKLAGPDRSSFYSAYSEVLATDGERLFVGMPDERIERPGAGAVYVYARKNGVFTYEQRIVASDPQPAEKIPPQQCTDGAIECGELTGRGFGAGLAVDGKHLIVGADRSFDGSPAELYDFMRDGAHFNERGKMRVGYAGTSSSPRAMPLLVIGEQALVGSPHANVRAGWWAGSAELLPLAYAGGTDQLIVGRELYALDPSADGGFGSALARTGHDLLIGAPGQNGGEVVVVHMDCSAL